MLSTCKSEVHCQPRLRLERDTPCDQQVACEISAPNSRCSALHQRHASQMFACIARTVEDQLGHSLLQASMPDEEERDCAPNKRKTITWTPNAFLSSLGHDMGFSISEGFNKASYNCQHLGLLIPHLGHFKHHECTCKLFASTTSETTSTLARNMQEPRLAHTSTYSPHYRSYSPRRVTERTASKYHKVTD